MIYVERERESDSLEFPFCAFFLSLCQLCRRPHVPVQRSPKRPPGSEQRVKRSLQPGRGKCLRGAFGSGAKGIATGAPGLTSNKKLYDATMR